MRRHALLKEPLKRAAARTRAQRSNSLWVTARLYASWRARALTLLTGGPFPLEREARLFLALARPAAGEFWLDVGTSSGFYAGVLAGAGTRVLALDLSPAMLKVARQREGSDLIGSDLIDWALLDIEASGLPGACFDGITIGATLNETAHPALALQEAARLLRPGGRLWLMYVAGDGGWLQRALSLLGGTTFPQRAQVASWLRGCERVSALQVGVVVFELFVRKPQS